MKREKTQKKEPCEDAVSRKQVITEIKKWWRTALDAKGSPLICKIIKELPPAQLNQDWIPISEGLPKKDGSYLVTSRDLVGGKLTASTVFECVYVAGVWIYHGWESNEILAWMPKPAPYRMDKGLKICQ